MPADPFVVHAARLRRVPGTRWHEIRRGPFDPEHVMAPRSPADTAVPEGAEAVCDVVLESYPGGVMATGGVRAPWRGLCRRCAVPVAGELDVALRECFTDAPGPRVAAPARAQPTQVADDETYPIVDDTLDLRPMIRDAIVLELPLAPLCRTDCRGLCPQCGADLNDEACDCCAPRDPRWANLDVLRTAQ